jgi:ribonucleoside-triphosphate reductase
LKIRRIRKRDGREVPFDKQKIAEAVGKAQSAVGETDALFASEVSDIVELSLARHLGERTLGPPAASRCPHRGIRTWSSRP